MSRSKSGPFISEARYHVADAMAYGESEAVVLWHIRYWIMKNKADNKNVHPDKFGDLRHWTYDSRKALNVLFPHYSPSKVQRVIESLVKQEAILQGNFNKSSWDRTSWYTVYDDSSISAQNTSHEYEDVSPD